jgi:hypothetical protein
VECTDYLKDGWFTATSRVSYCVFFLTAKLVSPPYVVQLLGEPAPTVVKHTIEYKKYFVSNILIIKSSSFFLKKKKEDHRFF